MAFWIACSMKAIKEQIDEQPKIIKLFSINYARDLMIKNYYNHLIYLLKRTYKIQSIVNNAFFPREKQSIFHDLILLQLD